MAKKPITVARQEYIEAVASLTNHSGLPMFVMGDALREILRQVDDQAARQYSADKKTYEEALQQEEDETEGGETNGLDH